MKKGTMALMGLATFFFVKGVFFPDRWFDLGFITMKTANLMWVLIFLTAVAGDAVWDKWKYKSNNIQTYNYSSSLNPNDVHKVGDWIVTRTGGINVTGFNQKGNEATVVAPIPSFEWLEQDATFHAVTPPVKKDYLPRKVKEFIEMNNFPDGEIRFGVAPDIVEHNNKAFIDWKEDYEKENMGLNKEDEIMDSVMEKAENVAEWTERVNKNKKIGKMQRKLEQATKKSNGDED